MQEELTLPADYLLSISRRAWGSTLNLEAVRSAETSVKWNQTTWRHISEENNLRIHWPEKPESHSNWTQHWNW
jgi:hypothetical protein